MDLLVSNGQFVFPPPISLAPAHRTRPIPGGDCAVLVGKEHPMPDIAATGNGAQGAGAIQAAVDFRASMAAEQAGVFTGDGLTVGVEQPIDFQPLGTRHKYQAAAVRWGLQAAPSSLIARGFGVSLRPLRRR